MPNHKRKSLSQGPFEGLQNENNHTGKTPAPKRQRFDALFDDPDDYILDNHLGRSIRGMLSPLSKEALVINMDDDAYEYNILQKSPKELHQELRRHITDVKEGLEQSEDKSDLDEHIIDELARMVYGSNMIENVGGGLDITLKLCKDVFRGGKEPPEEISERDPDYEQLEIYLSNNDLPCKHADILQSYREIVQHAKAARFMIEQVCINGKDLSEDIIVQAHGDLTYKIEISEHISWNVYSGRYRLWNVRCGSQVFMDHSKVRIAMRDMIEELESDIKKATNKGQIDPVALASTATSLLTSIPLETATAGHAVLFLTLSSLSTAVGVPSSASGRTAEIDESICASPWRKVWRSSRFSHYNMPVIACLG
jgi:hypothetical protein